MALLGLRLAPALGRSRPVRIAAALVALGVAVPLAGQPPVSKEYQVKAAFLFHFAQFVRWPAGFADSNGPLKIGILGEDPFGPFLDAIVRGESVERHPLAILRSSSAADLEDCQIVFVSPSERGRLDGILAVLDHRSILTVSEIPGFAKRGGIVDFYKEGNRVRFEVNPTEAARDGLKISSEMLSVGKIVEGGT